MHVRIRSRTPSQRPSTYPCPCAQSQCAMLQPATRSTPDDGKSRHQRPAPPFYDFSVSFVARIEPMAIRSFVVETVELRAGLPALIARRLPTARATATS